MRLAEDKRIRVVGFNYKDSARQCAPLPRRYGNPFVASGRRRERARRDRVGRLRRAGKLRDRPRRQDRLQAGPGRSRRANLDRVLKPELEKALAAGS